MFYTLKTPATPLITKLYQKIIGCLGHSIPQNPKLMLNIQLTDLQNPWRIEGLRKQFIKARSLSRVFEKKGQLKMEKKLIKGITVKSTCKIIKKALSKTKVKKYIFLECLLVGGTVKLNEYLVKIFPKLASKYLKRTFLLGLI